MNCIQLIKVLILIAFCFSVKAEGVTFKVIAINGKPSVVIDAKEYPMTLDVYPVYKTVVDNISLPVNYHYKIINDNEIKEESFSRTCQSSETLNEFFDRSITYKKLPLLPKVYETYSTFKKSKLFDDNFVSTIIINADEGAVKNLHADPDGKAKILNAQVIYVDPFEVKTFQGANLSVAGQSTVNCKKLSYKISNLKTTEGKELYNRSAIKLRANYRDPSYIREKLYIDMLNTLGVPTIQARFSRLFINGKEAGIYTLTDVITNRRYLRNTFNNGVKFNVANALFKVDYWENGNLFGNLQVNESTDMYYYKGEEEIFDNSEMVKNILVPFINEIDQYPTTQKLNFDSESFLKCMVMEYAAGAQDNFWIRPGNYYLYKDMAKNYWHFHDSDFHFTFGLAVDGAISDSKTLLDATIEGYAKTNPGIPTFERPLLDNLRKNPKNEAFFMEAFKKFTEKVFNLNAVEGRIDAMVDLIHEDVKWDLNLEKLSTFTGPELQIFNYNNTYFESQVKDVNAYPGQINYFPIKYWIKTRQDSLAQQLSITIPEKVDASLGYYEPATHKIKNEEKNGIISEIKPNFSILICLLSIVFYLI